MIVLNKLASDALEVAKEREKKGQLRSDSFSILKHCAGEVVEATDALAEYEHAAGLVDCTEANYDKCKNDFADELADIITCALIAAALKGVDIEAALLRVQEKNARRAG